MNAAFEFFFCPQHGIFRPDSWAVIGALYPYLRDHVTAMFHTYHHNRLRRLGVL